MYWAEERLGVSASKQHAYQDLLKKTDLGCKLDLEVLKRFCKKMQNYPENGFQQPENKHCAE